MTEPFHHGERTIQELAGERSQAILNGRVIATTIPAAARPFVRQQSYVALGWRDGSANAWAALVVGQPGFVSCDGAGTVVTIQPSVAAGALGTFYDDIQVNDALGMLFIDLGTRRRLRVNGVVERSTNGELRVAVEQAFPNCPKYIQRREGVETAQVVSSRTRSTGLGAPAGLAAWLSRADTAFLASAGPDGRVDCSHRGGTRGFMRMDGDAVLVPDYPGNSMFCSLGNMSVEPRAGLVIVDFEAQQQLHLSGDASVEVSTAERTGLTGGTGRWWRLTPRRWVTSPLPGTTTWRLIDESPFNPRVEP
ncbi:MAG: pyridoxamine 5'-phosphate oxidase family protein [Vicinamibacterales bacterium]